MLHNKWFLMCLSVLFVVLAGILCIALSGGKVSTSVDSSDQPIAKEKIVHAIVTNLSKEFYPLGKAEAGNMRLAGNVLDGLVAFDKNNQIVPNLASSWDNPDNNTWRFYLDPKAEFSDGTAVTAEDVKASWDFIQNDTPIKDLLPAVDQVKITDPATVEFITKSPNPILVNRLANNFLVMSKKDLDANRASTISSGPYKLVSLSETGAVLIRNDNYWKTKPLVKNIEIKYIPEESDRIKALIAGDVDFATIADTTDSQIVTAVQNGKLRKQNSSRLNSVYMLALDTGRDVSSNIPLATNPLKTLKVRQALYQAIDIDAVIAASSPADQPATQVVTKGIFGYNSSITRLEYDPTVAKKLLTDAGYPNGFEVTIDAPKNDRNTLELQAIAKQWEAIGLKVNLNLAANIDDFYALTDERKTSVYLVGYAPDSKDANEVLGQQFHTTVGNYGPYNLSYSNTTVDGLIEDADQNLTQKTRLTDMQQATKQLSDDIAFIPLGEAYDSYLYAKDILWTPQIGGEISYSQLAGRASN